ncbi:transcriptional regulator Kaiso [Gouania willdenowi]|uniref:Transcriptional regulator Kaiso n=1 Tax=Gouania willdenowi TaxID=441366 RepID=A0A8C5HBB3_GOUWI|nr:transcriptional regulator Kaiso [Gouania willdenowi]
MPNLKLISATDTQYSIAVLKSLNEQRNLGLFCDVTVIIQDKKFRAHKTVLAASSTYFHQLFTVAGQVIELNFIRPETFELIINYIYTSKLTRVRSDMLEELISAGEVLGVKFIANLALPLSQVEGLPGLSKDTDSKTNKPKEVMPIINDSFSISSEEFNKPADNTDEDSDSDVMFVSHTNTLKSNDIIDLDKIDSESVETTQKIGSNHSAVAKEGKTMKPLNGPKPALAFKDSNSTSRVHSGSAPATPAKASTHTTEPVGASPPSDSCDVIGVHKKHVSTSSHPGQSKLRLLDLSSSPTLQQIHIPNSAAKKTVTLKAATEIGSISPGCKVYANIGEDTYDIVPPKEDPQEGGSKANKGKRTLMATPLKPIDDTHELIEPDKKKNKMEVEDHYELVMDGKTFYVCNVCKRPYVCLPSLRRHFNTHSWEKKYPCRFCNKVFALAEYRTKHEIIHTGERRYQCLLCNGMFPNYQLLSNHCKQAHNEDPSGRKEKDFKDNNLYRLLPFRSEQRKSHSGGRPVISEDGSVHHIPNVGDGDHASPQGRLLNWDDFFIEPNAHTSLDARSQTGSNTSPQPVEFDFAIPETY